MGAIIVLGFFLFILPRKKAILPMLLMACFISPAQRMVIFGLDFNLIRIMVLFGWMRIILKGEIEFIKFNKLDFSIIIWTVVQIVIYYIQNKTASAVIFKLGVSFDAIGMYFLFRSLIRGKEDIEQIFVYFIYISFPVMLFFILERITGHNIFSIFGGVPEITAIRQGRLRVQGAFAHPILGGCFWASVLPFLVAELYGKTIRRNIIYLGILSIFTIVVLSASSTPILSILMGLIGGVMYKFRYRMKEILLLLLLAIIGLDIVMKAPVYHLIARIDLTGSSTGWHRFHLIDQAVINWRDWFVFGVSDIDYWGVFNNDVTNQYVLEGIRGGILSLLLFLIVIMFVFRYCGILTKIYEYNKSKSIFYWSIGVSFFMHISNFIAVSYFGQIWLLWYLCIAMTGSSYQYELNGNLYEENGVTQK